ncbi:MAG: prepilin-type N-terminal cleavage/methylation domain-containing protein [Candidatus Roizmanbacteria bacterium]
MKQFKKGFTLIELLVVITIIAVFAGIVYVGVNPSKRIADAQNARRSTDIDQILSAVHQYIVDNNGTIPSGISATELQLGSATSGCAISSGGCAVTTAGCLDLSSILAGYLKSIPADPLPALSAGGKTGYSIMSSSGIITVRACGATGSNIVTSQ